MNTMTDSDRFLELRHAEQELHNFFRALCTEVGTVFRIELILHADISCVRNVVDNNQMAKWPNGHGLANLATWSAGSRWSLQEACRSPGGAVGVFCCLSALGFCCHAGGTKCQAVVYKRFGGSKTPPGKPKFMAQLLRFFDFWPNFSMFADVALLRFFFAVIGLYLFSKSVHLSCLVIPVDLIAWTLVHTVQTSHPFSHSSSFSFSLKTVSVLPCLGAVACCLAYVWTVFFSRMLFGWPFPLSGTWWVPTATGDRTMSIPIWTQVWPSL